MHKVNEQKYCIRLSGSEGYMGIYIYIFFDLAGLILSCMKLKEKTTY